MHLMTLPVLVLFPFFGLTSGLQQSPTPPVSTRRLVSFQQQATCLWSASVADDIDGALDSLTDEDEQIIQPAYDWDEQFAELQSFMSEHGHCNFPQNPPMQLQKKYPTLKRFCHDQRVEYKLSQSSKPRNKKSLVVFDRDVRFRRLEELGFEFSLKSAPWYDYYHELIQYSTENGHVRVTERENVVLAKWIYDQRGKRDGKLKTYKRLTESQIKLLDDIGFEWKSEHHDELWTAKYEELVAFRNKHGHIMVEATDSLYNWMYHQRNRRTNPDKLAPITDEQLRMLDEIGFPWKPFLQAKWYDMYDKLKRFQKKHGHCQPDTSNQKLYKWSHFQQRKHRKGRLSTEQIKLLDQLNFPLEREICEWPKLLNELTEYFNSHGHLQVGQEDDPDLYEWMAILRKRYHGIVQPAMTDHKIEKLEEIQFCWSLDWRERTWHKKYTEVVEFFKEHGHLAVTEKDHPSLHNWIQMQGKRYKELKGQKPLSEEELGMLEDLDFPFFDGQPRMAWNGKYAEVERYREENDGRFPTSHKDDPILSRWMRQQRRRYRHEYGYAPLSDEQKASLESIGFPRYPEGKSLRYWYEKYDELVEFWKQHGHFLVKEKDISLHYWIEQQRANFRGRSTHSKPLSKSQIYLLERIGFPWTYNQNETKWQRNYDEVVKFVEVWGHFPSKTENRKLYRWILEQRQRYNGTNQSRTNKLSEHQIQQLEKIGFRWSMYKKDT